MLMPACVFLFVWGRRAAPQGRTYHTRVSCGAFGPAMTPVSRLGPWGLMRVHAHAACSCLHALLCSLGPIWPAPIPERDARGFVRHVRPAHGPHIPATPLGFVASLADRGELRHGPFAAAPTISVGPHAPERHVLRGSKAPFFVRQWKSSSERKRASNRHVF